MTNLEERLAALETAVEELREEFTELLAALREHLEACPAAVA
jgi:hypothetical protein